VSAIIRILGYAWLVMTITATVAEYVFIWALDGAAAVASTFAGAFLGVAALLAPGVVLVVLATWLDWRQGRWSTK
jgi:hypothetical protein